MVAVLVVVVVVVVVVVMVVVVVEGLTCGVLSYDVLQVFVLSFWQH